jgi:hypothetical protein
MTSDAVNVEFTGSSEHQTNSNGTTDGEAVSEVEKLDPSLRSRHAVLPGKGISPHLIGLVYWFESVEISRRPCSRQEIIILSLTTSYVITPCFTPQRRCSYRRFSMMSVRVSDHTDVNDAGDEPHRVVDVFSMGRDTKRKLVNAALHTEDQDHEEYLKKLRERMDE